MVAMGWWLWDGGYGMVAMGCSGKEKAAVNRAGLYTDHPVSERKLSTFDQMPKRFPAARNCLKMVIRLQLSDVAL
jgi:hypothetical protein